MSHLLSLSICLTVRDVTESFSFYLVVLLFVYLYKQTLLFG